MYFFGNKAAIRFSRTSIILSDIRDILIYGLPGAIAQFCIALRGFVLNYIIQRYVGPDGLAAYSAIFSFSCINWCVPAGVSSAVMVLGSVFNVLIVVIYAFLYNKKPPVTLEQMMGFDKDFGVPEENRIDITVHSMDEVINLSEHIWAFCENHGITDRRRYYSSLCTEELAGNIVRHGFRTGKKHSIDIRVSYINGEIMICLKDDGIPFNPEEASRLFCIDDEYTWLLTFSECKIKLIDIPDIKGAIRAFDHFKRSSVPSVHPDDPLYVFTV